MSAVPSVGVSGASALSVNGVRPVGVSCVRPVGVSCVRPVGVIGVRPVGVSGASAVGVSGASAVGVSGASAVGVIGVRPVGVSGASAVGVSGVTPVYMYAVPSVSVSTVSTVMSDMETNVLYMEYNPQNLIFRDWLGSLVIPTPLDSLSQVKVVLENGARNCPPLKKLTKKMRLFYQRATKSTIYSQGVKKKDDYRKYFHRKINRCDAATNLLMT
ncbi:uncharacterized protein LOC116616303 [Nematostella vectensis]|uniref:uncharacterized protein LOC116616303 n=1 Tax=Nematostella vectensis TaxID=45351 RepID=UPI00138FF461|nr:uncharacterized protein LOC116616303 [Nematostella vectensis]